MTRPRPEWKPRYGAAPVLRNFNLARHAAQLKERKQVRGEIKLTGDTSRVHDSVIMSHEPIKDPDSKGELVGTIVHGGPVPVSGTPYTLYFYKQRRVPKR